MCISKHIIKRNEYVVRRNSDLLLGTLLETNKGHTHLSVEDINHNIGEGIVKTGIQTYKIEAANQNLGEGILNKKSDL